MKSEKPINQKINIAVFNLSGRKMISIEYSQFDFNCEYEIDLSDLSEGTYLLHISDDTDVEVFSIMKY